MYTETKYADPADTCLFCDGTPHIAYHECKVLHRTLHVSIYLSIYLDMCWIAPILGGQPCCSCCRCFCCG